MGTGVGEILAMAIINQVGTEMARPGKIKLPEIAMAPVLEMPDPLGKNDAQKKKIMEQMQRSGRASTILTDSGSDKLGG